MAWRCCCAAVGELTAIVLAHLPAAQCLKPVRLPVSDRGPGLGRMTGWDRARPAPLVCGMERRRSHSSGSAPGIAG